MKLIDLHKKWMEKGKFQDRQDADGCGGLCNAVPRKYLKILERFRPIEYKTYWGQRFGTSTSLNQIYGYNKIRQSIVLLICAMNNEL